MLSVECEKVKTCKKGEQHVNGTTDTLPERIWLEARGHKELRLLLKTIRKSNKHRTVVKTKTLRSFVHLDQVLFAVSDDLRRT